MTKRTEFVQGRRVEKRAGQFFVDIEVRAQPSASFAKALRALIDTESLFTWIPGHVLEDLGIMRRQPITFVTPEGEQFSRLAGYAFLTTSGAQTVDTVIFAEPGDPTLLGGRALAGMNLTPDAKEKALLPGGPMPVPANVAARA